MAIWTRRPMWLVPKIDESCLFGRGEVGIDIVSLYVCTSMVVYLSLSMYIYHSKYELLLVAGVAQQETSVMIAL